MDSLQYRVFVCTKQRPVDDPEGCCCDAGALEVYQALLTEIQKWQLSDRVEVRRSRCLGRCEAGVVALLYQPEQQLFSWLPTKLQIKLRRWLFPILEARRLMLAENYNAIMAADGVGYESPSQFSREYARLFGAPPIQDIDRLLSVG